MEASKRARSILKYLPVFAVVVAAVISISIAKDLYQMSFDSQGIITTRLPTEQREPQPMNILETAGSCGFGHFYTSYPPKCRMLDGSFIQAPGTSPYAVLIPKPK